MKGIILALSLTFISAVSCTYYYIPTTGNDLNPGTIGKTWIRCHKAFYKAKAGNTVYFRSEIYSPTNL